MRYIYSALINFSLIGVVMCFASTIHAAQIESDHSPKPVTQSSQNITLSFTNRDDDDVFLSNNTYTVRATGANSSCAVTGTSSNNSGTVAVRIVDADNISATWSLVGCRAEAGSWNYQLCLGQGTASCNNPGNVLAQGSYNIEQSGGSLPALIAATPSIQFGKNPVVTLVNPRQGNSYFFWWDGAAREFAAKLEPAQSDENVNINLDYAGVEIRAGDTKKICMDIGGSVLPAGRTCRYSTEITFTQFDNSSQQVACSLVPAKPKVNDSASLQVRNLAKGASYTAIFRVEDQELKRLTAQADDNGTALFNLSAGLAKNSYTAILQDGSGKIVCNQSFKISEEGSSTTPVNNLTAIPGCTEERNNCTVAAGKSCGEGATAGIQTAIGCVPTDPVTLINRLMSFAIGIAGGIALLLMMYGSFEMVTSQGDPKALANGRERFASAVIGLLFILFSVVFLKIIGVDILGLDAISKGVFGG